MSLDDPTPATLELLNISAPCADGFPCVLGDLEAGSAVALTVTFRVPEPYTGPNPLVNTATVTSEAPDPDPANNTATVQTLVSRIRQVSVCSNTAPSSRPAVRRRATIRMARSLKARTTRLMRRARVSSRRPGAC
jgi:hypothetical protein